MLVACGIVEQEGKVLICRRAAPPLAGFWEFPAAVPFASESLEDALEGEFFGRLSVNLCKVRPAFAFDSRSVPDCRIFAHFSQILGKVDALDGYDDAKWVHVNKLRKFRFTPDGVTIIKLLQKNSLFFRN